MELASSRYRLEQALFCSFLAAFAERLSAWQLEKKAAAAQSVSAQKAAIAPRRAARRITGQQVTALTDFLLGEPIKPKKKKSNPPSKTANVEQQ
jgi:hypothetical protein